MHVLILEMSVGLDFLSYHVGCHFGVKAQLI